MKSIILTTLALIVLQQQYIYSQESSIFQNTTQNMDFVNYHKLRGNDINLSDIEGTPYLNEEFQLGSILPLNKKFPVRYNALNDLFEVKQDNDSILTLNQSNTNYIIKLNNQSFKSFKYYTSPSDEKYGYFAILTEKDSINLLKKMSKSFVKEQKAANSYSSSKPAHFTKDPKVTYFILLNTSNTIKEVSANKKSFFAILPDKKDELKKYLSKNRLSLKKEEDLITFIEYINTLY